MANLAMPKRPRGRPSAAVQAEYAAALAAWCDGIKEIASSSDFRVSSRGWCYLLEPHGLDKGDFDVAQALINDCRKSGLLPLDICCEDDGRAAEHLEDLDDSDPEQRAAEVVDYIERAHLYYVPYSFWDGQDTYVEMLVEKVDLKSLFSVVCERYRVPLTNASGWMDLHCRAAMMRRFRKWQSRGKRCVLLYCGDHDPGGLRISGNIRKNFEDMSRAVGWSPDELIIDRFGLNRDFIDANGLTWIGNLSTSKGGALDDPEHNDHHKEYVQSYIEQFGARKVEANALVIRPVEGRELCRRAILRYLPEDAPEKYEASLLSPREQMRQGIRFMLGQEDD
jgi:hypothetical protein